MHLTEYSDIKNKENLLISLGCSWTQGVGCYLPKLLDLYFKKQISSHNLYKQSILNFYVNGWPNQLSKFLNYDLINLGLGGTSNKYAYIKFVELLDEKIDVLKNYKKVLVLFGLTEFSRICFYSNGDFDHYMLGQNSLIYPDLLKHTLLKNTDFELETAIYIKGIKQICDANNFNFYFFNNFGSFEILNQIINKDYNWHINYIKEDSLASYLNSLKYWNTAYAHCSHPNKFGYFLIAKKLHSIIINNNL